MLSDVLHSATSRMQYTITFMSQIFVWELFFPISFSYMVVYFYSIYCFSQWIRGREINQWTPKSQCGFIAKPKKTFESKLGKEKNSRVCQIWLPEGVTRSWSPGWVGRQPQSAIVSVFEYKPPNRASAAYSLS